MEIKGKRNEKFTTSKWILRQEIWSKQKLWTKLKSLSILSRALKAKTHERHGDGTQIRGLSGFQKKNDGRRKNQKRANEKIQNQGRSKVNIRPTGQVTQLQKIRRVKNKPWTILLRSHQ